MLDTVFTISPEKGGMPITLQYHPASLSMQCTTSTKSIQTLTDIVTYVAPASKNINTINVTAYLTAESKVTGNATMNTLAATLAGIGSGQAGAVSTVVTDNIRGMASMTTLMVGFVDLITGFIKPPIKLLSPFSIGGNYAVISKLLELQKNSEPCRINWDVENDAIDGIYFISGLSMTAETLDDRDGATLVVKLDMSFTTHGRRVETNA